MLMLTEHELASTDIADHALEVLAASQIREVVVVARRGPEQAAFTNPELLELADLSEADVVVDPAELALVEGLSDPNVDATGRRNHEILRRYASSQPTGKPRRVVLRFLLSPLSIEGERRVESLTLARNELPSASATSSWPRRTGACVPARPRSG
jgi:ferredoxin--NADP+ reductase